MPTYRVTPKSENDASFKSFICALLVFLGLCIIIYLFLLMGTSYSHKKNDKKGQVESFKNDGDSERDKLILINVPEPVTVPTTTTTTRTTATTSPTTQKYTQPAVRTPLFVPTTQSTTQSPVKFVDYYEDYDYYDTFLNNSVPKTTRKKTETSISPRTSTTTTTSTSTTTATSTSTTTSTPSTTTSSSTSGIARPKIFNVTNPVASSTETVAIGGTNPVTTDGVTETSSSTSTDPRTNALGITNSVTSSSTDAVTFSSTSIDPNSFAGRTDSIITSTGTESETFTSTSIDPRTNYGRTHPIIPSTMPQQTTTDSYDWNNTQIASSSSNFTTTLSSFTTDVATTDIPTTLDDNSTVFSTDTIQSSSSTSSGSSTSSTSGSSSTTPSSGTSDTTTELTTEAPTTMASTMQSSVAAVQIQSNATPAGSTISNTQVTQATQATTVSAQSVTTSSTSSTASTTPAVSATTRYQPRKSSSSLGHLFPVIRNNNACDTSVCKTTASRMLSLMNHAAEECEQFYEFACGGSNVQNSAESDDVDMLSTYLQSLNKSSGKYLKDFQKFHDSCVNHEKLFKYGERLSILEDDLSMFDLTQLFTELILTESLPFINVGIGIDKDTSTYILQLTLGGHSAMRNGLKDWTIFDQVKKVCLKDQKAYLNEPLINLTNIYESYQTCQKDKLGLLLGNFVEEMQGNVMFMPSLNNQTFDETNLNNTLLLLDILNNYPSESLMRETLINKNYELYNITRLQQKYPLLNWTQLFTDITGHAFQDHNFVQLYFANYFTKIFDVFTTFHNNGTLGAALQMFRNINLYTNTIMPKEKENRERYCMSMSKQLMPDIVTAIYKSQYSSGKLTAQNLKLTMLFKELQTIFEAALRNATWLDDVSRDGFVKKLHKLRLALVSRGDTQLIEQKLESNYHELNLTDNYQTNVIELLKHYKKMVYSLEQTNVTEGTLYSYFVNVYDTRPQAFYSTDLIVAPAGIFQRTSMTLPDYILKARVSFHLAQAIAKHFDPVGAHYKTHLTLKPIQTYNSITTNTEDFIASYKTKAFNGKQLHFKIDGKLSANQAIVENAAMRMVFDSFQTFNGGLMPWISLDFSREKLFFMATAQEYCQKIDVLDFMLLAYESEYLPPNIRVENIMDNSEPFSSFFSCPKGSTLNSNRIKLQFPHTNDVYDYSFTNY